LVIVQNETKNQTNRSQSERITGYQRRNKPEKQKKRQDGENL